jgi:4-hydroxy-tetrahydrodipicolinate reductase
MSNKFKYGLIGASGRLGGEVIKVFSDAGHNLVFSYDIDGETKKEKPELLIDCSLPDVFPKTMEFVKQFNVPLIIATTGLSSKNLDELKSISKNVAVVQSFNFSRGIQVLLKLTELANDKFGDWDIEITETHHRFKKDKPSGTAKMIQNIFEGKEIHTSSMRLGNVPGEHTVSFGGLGEVLSITHSATSRRTFAEGILLSVEFIIYRSKGLFSFTDVVFPK